MENKFLKKLGILFIIVFLLSLVPILMLSPYCLPIADDFAYGYDTHEVILAGGNIFEVIIQAFKSVGRYYIEWQGTYTSCFLMTLQPGIFGMKFYYLTPFIMLFALSFSTFFFFKVLIREVLGMSKSLSAILSCLVLFVQIQAVKDVAESFTWYNASVHYTVGHSIFMIYLALGFRHIYRRKNNEKSLGILVFIFAFLTAGVNNVTIVCGLLVALTAIGLAICSKISFFKDKFELDIRFRDILPSSIIMLIGCIVNIKSPGNAYRLEYMGGSHNSVVATILKSFESGAEYIVKWNDTRVILFVIWIIFVCLLFNKQLKSINYDFKFPGLVTLYSFCFLSASFASGIYTSQLNTENALPIRAENVSFFVYIILLSINAIYWTSWFLKKEFNLSFNIIYVINEKMRGLTILLSVISAAIFIYIAGINLSFNYFTSTSAFADVIGGDAAYYKEQMLEGFALLEDDSLSDVEISRLKDVWPETLITQESDSWISGTKRYYHKNSVEFVNEDGIIWNH